MLTPYAAKMQRWTTVADKAAWGYGPWVDEPDKAQWVDAATGLPCLAKRNPRQGFWCGYVGVHRGHPWYGLGYNDVDVEVHGGLTYADAYDDDVERPIEERICHIPAPGEPDDVWWFGFDCGHAFDLCPAMEARYREEMERAWLPGGLQTRYCDLSYVQQECAELAKQLGAVR